MPPMDVIEEYFKTYFYRTKKGLELQISDDSSTRWPFDDEGTTSDGSDNKFSDGIPGHITETCGLPDQRRLGFGHLSRGRAA